MAFTKVTEESSKYRHVEKMSVGEIIKNVNKEDFLVAPAVEKALPELEKLIKAVSEKMMAKKSRLLLFINNRRRFHV